jgi:hypothetical protein
VLLSLLGHPRKGNLVELILEGPVEEPGQLALRQCRRLGSGCNYLLILFSITEFSFPPYMGKLIQSIDICLFTSYT